MRTERILGLGCLLLICQLDMYCETLQTSELALRRSARKKVLPPFPRAAIRAKVKGVAVAEIACDQTGKVVQVKILEVPHPSIAKSFEATLAKWEFDVPKGRLATVTTVGKLTFYYVWRSGEPIVLNADEAPFLGLKGRDGDMR